MIVVRIEELAVHSLELTATEWQGMDGFQRLALNWFSDCFF